MKGRGNEEWGIKNENACSCLFPAGYLLEPANSISDGS